MEDKLTFGMRFYDEIRNKETALLLIDFDKCFCESIEKEINLRTMRPKCNCNEENCTCR